MGYTNLKESLDAVVKTNGRQQITGANLNGVMTTLLQGVDVLDRANPADTSGMNHVVLKSNKTFAEQVTGTNTIYEVRDSFSLAGSFSMPSGSVLVFNGGKIQGGTLVGNHTLVVGDYVFDNVTFSGTFRCDQVDIDSTHFLTSVDFFGIMKCFSESKLNLLMDITKTTKDVSLIPKLNLNGNGHTIKVVCLAFAQTADVKIKNCNFDCSIAESSLIHNNNSEGGYWDIYGDGTNDLEIQNCTFDDIPGGFNFTYFRNVGHINISKCEFDGTLDPSNVQDEGGKLIDLYTIIGGANIESCKFTNYHGVAISGMGNTSQDTAFAIRNNYIANMGRGGIVFFGGEVHNVEISGNIINDVNLVESASGGDHSAINLHGFNNVVVSNNNINALKATGIDIDGSLSGSTIIEKGDNIRFYGNNVVCRGVIFWVVKNVNIFDNVFDLQGGMTLSGQIDVRNNLIKGVATSSAGVVTPKVQSGYTFTLDVSFYENNVLVKTASPNTNWLYIAASNSGVVRLRGTKAILESTGKMANFYDASNIIEFEDGYEKVVKRINLSVASKEILIQRGRFGALMDAISYSIDGGFNVSPAFDLTVGVARPGAAPDDSRYGTITLSGAYNATAKTHAWTGSRPNNTQAATNGDVYLVCPGGGQDVNVCLEFTCLYGYKPYY